LRKFAGIKNQRGVIHKAREKIMPDAIKNHWKEYLIEAWGLGMFMVSACVFGVLLFHPSSPMASLNSFFRMVLMGLAMGSTAIGIFLSPWGKRSGSHINPAVTLTFLRLGKIKPFDAIFYVIFQFIGGTTGVLLSWLILGNALSNSTVNYVATIPNNLGATVSFMAEFVISFLMMSMVLITTNSKSLSRFTPFIAGVFVALFITFESPISGMSMNPARSFASAVVANNWSFWWIYFTAPPLAMLSAAEVYVFGKGIRAVHCAKFHHANSQPCIFNCNYGEMN
jgi:aquaporin Z